MWIEPFRMNILKIGLLVLLAVLLPVYLAVCTFVWVKQESLLFFPSHELVSTPKALGLDFTDLDVKVKAGVNLSGWKIPPPPSAIKPIWVLHCHGNGGNISHRLEVARVLHDLGFGVVLFDYRGYGKSSGQLHCQADLIEDAEAMLKSLPEGKRVLFGESLGGGAVCQLALKHNVEAVILQSTFSSLNSRAADSFPFLPIGLLSRYPLDSLAAVKVLSIPKLILHSPNDEVTSVSHGRRLFEGASEPKMWGELRGGHNDYDLKSLSEPLKEFSQKYLN